MTKWKEIGRKVSEALRLLDEAAEEVRDGVKESPCNCGKPGCTRANPSYAEKEFLGNAQRISQLKWPTYMWDD